MKVNEILKIYLDSKRELEKNTEEAAKKGERVIENMGALINKIDIAERLLRECDLDIELDPNDAQFLQ
ncbi:MAG: hypothetical protein WC678_02365 [Parcubacteria group bacterium]|jgi:hypothetical protein